MRSRALIAVTLATASLAVSGGVAQAIPPGDNLIVFAYYSDSTKTHLIGQKWWGCGQPAGSWGTLAGYQQLYFTPC